MRGSVLETSKDSFAQPILWYVFYSVCTSLVHDHDVGKSQLDIFVKTNTNLEGLTQTCLILKHTFAQIFLSVQFCKVEMRKCPWNLDSLFRSLILKHVYEFLQKQMRESLHETSKSLFAQTILCSFLYYVCTCQFYSLSVGK